MILNLAAILWSSAQQRPDHPARPSLHPSPRLPPRSPLQPRHPKPAKKLEPFVSRSPPGRDALSSFAWTTTSFWARPLSSSTFRTGRSASASA